MTLTSDAKRKNGKINPFLHRILQGGGKRRCLIWLVFWGFVLFFFWSTRACLGARRLQGRKSRTPCVAFVGKFFFQVPRGSILNCSMGRQAPQQQPAAAAVGQPRGIKVGGACVPIARHAGLGSWHGLWPSVQSALPTVCVTPACSTQQYIGRLGIRGTCWGACLISLSHSARWAHSLCVYYVSFFFAFQRTCEQCCTLEHRVRLHHTV